MSEKISPEIQAILDRGKANMSAQPSAVEKEEQNLLHEDPEIDAILKAGIAKAGFGKSKAPDVAEEVVKEDEPVLKYEPFTINDVQEQVYDEYFMERGIPGPIGTQKRFNKAIERGVSPLDAAKEAGIPTDYFQTGEGIVEKAIPFPEWQDLQDGAVSYTKEMIQQRVVQKTNANIDALRRDIDAIDLTSPDVDESDVVKRGELISALGKEIILREQYGGRTVMSREEMREALDDVRAFMHFSGKIYEPDIAKLPKMEGGYMNLTPGTMSDPTLVPMSEYMSGRLDQSLDNIKSVIEKFDNVPPPDKGSIMGDIEWSHPAAQELYVPTEYNSDHILARESKKIMNEAISLYEKAEDPDNFFVSAANGAVAHFAELFDILVTARDRNSMREIRKGVVGSAVEKFKKVGAGEMKFEELSDAEQMYYVASATAGDVLLDSASRIPFSTELGDMAGRTLGFIAEIYATGGRSAAVRSAAKASVGAFLQAGRVGAPSLAAKFTANAAGALSQATVQTALMPSTTIRAIDRYVEGENWQSAIWNSYMDNYGDVLASSIFVAPEVGTALSRGASKFWARTNTMYGSVTGAKSFMQASLKEFGEEQFAAAFHAIRGSDSISDVLNNMPTARQQLQIGMMVTGFAGAGPIANNVMRAKSLISYNMAGKKLGSLREGVDTILGTEGVSMEDALIMASELVDSNIEGKNRVKVFSDVVRYMSEYYNGIRPDGSGASPDIDAIFSEDVGLSENLGDKNKWSLKSKTQDFSIHLSVDGKKEAISLGRKLSLILNKYAAGEYVSVDDLTFARDALVLLETNIDNASNKAKVGEIKSDLNEVLNDMVPKSEIVADLKNKAHYSVTKNKLDDVEGANTSNYRMTLRGNKAGYVQKVDANGDISYRAFSEGKKLLGEFKNPADAEAALRKAYQNLKAARKARIIKGEGTPKQFVAEYRKVLKEAALEGASSSSPFDALRAKSEVADAIAELKARGKINAEQAISVAKYLGKVDMRDPVKRESFMRYTELVLDDAANIQNIERMNDLRTRVRKRAKGKHVRPSASRIAKAFSNIDPLFVADIEAYNNVASQLMGGMADSKVSVDADGDVSVEKSATLNEAEVSRYIDKELERQANEKAEMQARINEEITGYRDMSLEDIRSLSDDSVAEKLEKKNRKSDAIKAYVKNWMDGAKARYLEVSKDGFTESGVPISKSQAEQRAVRQAMDIDLNNLSGVQALRLMDAVDSYLVNGNTFGLRRMVNVDAGITSAKVLASILKGDGNQDHRAFAFKTLYDVGGTTATGRFMGEQFAALPLFVENIFRGRTVGSDFLKQSGLRDVMNGYSKSVTEARKAGEAFYKKYGSSKVHGLDFMDETNIYERGMWAAISRIKDLNNADTEFETTKKFIQEGIEDLRKGDKRSQEMAGKYQEVFDRFLSGANNLAEAKANLESAGGAGNIEAVSWWVNHWDGKVDALSELAEGVYNKVLDRETNYTPLTWRKVRKGQGNSGTMEVDLADVNQSIFNAITNSMPDRESTVLMTRSDLRNKPKDKYLDLNFDANMTRALEGALVDLNTTYNRIHLQGFMNSEYFNQMFNDVRMSDVLKKRVVSYVQDIAGAKVPISTESVKKFIGFVQGYAATRALARSTMMFQQVVPVMINTFANAGFSFDLRAVIGPDAEYINKLIDNSGRAIANRGVESLGDVADPRRFQAGMSSNSKKLGVSLADKYLNTFLVRPDRWVARASWITYYKQYLKNKGIDVSKIDWEKHRLNEHAADYAQDMVDRQQNVSDANLMGEFLKNKSDAHKMMRSLTFVFANFVMNQKMRMHTDFAVLTSQHSSTQDRNMATRSLIGLFAEQTAFHALGAGIRYTMQSLVNKLLGFDDDREAKELARRTTKNTLQYLATDIASPMPFLDRQFIGTLRGITNAITTVSADEPADAFSIYGGDDVWGALGTIGIAASDVREASRMGFSAISGKYLKEFAGNTTVKYLTDEEQALMGTAALMRMAHILGLVPTDFKMIANYIDRGVDRQAQTRAGQKRTMKQLMKMQESSSGTVGSGTVGSGTVGEGRVGE